MTNRTYTGIDADTDAVGVGEVAPTHIVHRIVDNVGYHNQQGPHQTWTWLHGDTRDTDSAGPLSPVGAATRATYEERCNGGFLNFLPSTAPSQMAYDAELSGLPTLNVGAPLPIRMTEGADMDVYVVVGTNGTASTMRVSANTYVVSTRRLNTSLSPGIYRHTINRTNVPGPVGGLVAEQHLRVQWSDNADTGLTFATTVRNIRFNQIIEIDALWSDDLGGLRDLDTCPGRYPWYVVLPRDKVVRVAQVRPSSVRREQTDSADPVACYDGRIELVLEHPILRPIDLDVDEPVVVASIGQARLLSITAQTVTAR